MEQYREMLNILERMIQDELEYLSESGGNSRKETALNKIKGKTLKTKSGEKYQLDWDKVGQRYFYIIIWNGHRMKVAESDFNRTDVDTLVSVMKRDMENFNEAMSPTERSRRFRKRHPKKVASYLKDTVKDRSARNKDRAKAVKKYGKAKMKNHDVHHPGPTQGGNWRLAKRDHGPDVKEKNKNKK